MNNITRRSALGIFGGVACGLAACATQTTSDAGSGSDVEAGSTAGSAAANTAVTVRVGSLKGPTTMGIASLINDAQFGDLVQPYEFTVSSTPDELLPSLIKGDLDIALLPANAAAVVYNKTKGGVEAIDVNTLGVLSVVTHDANITGFADLAGHTVYLTGKGASPEYVVNYLLQEAGIADQVTLEFKDEPAEVIATLAADATAVGILPQPFVTVATTKDDTLLAPIDLTDVWEETVTDGSSFVMGVTVARKDFLEANPAAVGQFLEDHAASVKAINDDPAAVAPYVVSAGVVDSEAIAAKAAPACHIVCLTGDDLRDALEGYLTVLHDAAPTSVGGELPADDFYYTA